MRKLKLIEHISLDGVIQHSADDGDFPYSDWTAPYRSPAGLAMVLAAQGESFDLLLGRRTYDLWSGFWPKAPKSPMEDSLKDGADLIRWGSSTLTSALLDHGLADEALLLVYPVLLGKGKRFFAEGTPARTLALDSTRASQTGILVNTYKVVGPLQNQR